MKRQARGGDQDGGVRGQGAHLPVTKNISTCGVIITEN